VLYGRQLQSLPSVSCNLSRPSAAISPIRQLQSVPAVSCNLSHPSAAISPIRQLQSVPSVSCNLSHPSTVIFPGRQLQSVPSISCNLSHPSVAICSIRQLRAAAADIRQKKRDDRRGQSSPFQLKLLSPAVICQPDGHRCRSGPWRTLRSGREVRQPSLGRACRGKRNEPHPSGSPGIWSSLAPWNRE